MVGTFCQHHPKDHLMLLLIFFLFLISSLYCPWSLLLVYRLQSFLFLVHDLFLLIVHNFSCCCCSQAISFFSSSHPCSWSSFSSLSYPRSSYSSSFDYSSSFLLVHKVFFLLVDNLLFFFFLLLLSMIFTSSCCSWTFSSFSSHDLLFFSPSIREYIDFCLDNVSSITSLSTNQQCLQTHGKLLVTMVLHLGKGHPSTQKYHVWCYFLWHCHWNIPISNGNVINNGPKKTSSPNKTKS